MEQKIKNIINQGEGIRIEFKEAKNEIPSNVYETVCAFLNTKGGDILLGVNDNGEIVGVNKNSALDMQKSFVGSMNNMQFLNPPFCIELGRYEIDGKIILHAFIPESSQVHRYKNKIYLRKNDSDLDITNNQSQATSLYMQKQSSYSENNIFPAVKLEDLRQDLITRARNLALRRNPNHIWQDMDDMAMLKTMCLYQKDLTTGQEGFTRACILLFGTDEFISSANPAFKLDLIKRVHDKDRYDDREIITTNLIECYDKAMAFIEKHLPDKFYLENDQRISLRNIIFRELIANILVHKEYLGAEPTKLVIEKNGIYTENSNKPYINGLVDLSNLKAHPKNPNISRLFREIGRVEELGSGMTKLFKYSKHYFDSLPVLKDCNLFKVNIQTDLMMSLESDTVESDTVESDTVESDTVEEKKKRNVDEELIKDILNFCKSPKKSADIARFAHYKNKRNFIIKFLNPMIEKGLLKRTYPNSLNSPHQKYETVIND